MMNRSRWASAIIIFLLVSSFSEAYALGVMTIAGTVKDPVGRPLAGVRVTDGRGKTVYTNSAGAYSIEESQPSTYVVTASRKGLNPKSRVVGPVEALQPVDFTLTYGLSGTISPVAFNNEPPVTLSIIATTYAPATGTCVTFTDLTSGSQVVLSFEPPVAADGSSRWTGSHSVPPGRADGTYKWQLRANDCGNVLLSNVPTYTYVIDSVAPVLAGVTPIDGGNASVSPLSIHAAIQDGSSGVNPSGLGVSVTDLGTAAAPTSVTTQLSVQSFDSTTGLLKSGQFSTEDLHK